MKRMSRWFQTVFLVAAAWGSPALAAADSFDRGSGRDGALKVSEPCTVVNRYTRVTAAVAAGDSRIEVDNASGLAAGDLVLVFQAGPEAGSAPSNWELARLASVKGKHLELTEPLRTGYAVSGTQVVRVPEYSTASISNSGSVVARPWHEGTGGVVAFLVQGALVHQGLIDASGSWRGETPTSLMSKCSGSLQSGGVVFIRAEQLSGAGGISAEGDTLACASTGSIQRAQAGTIVVETQVGASEGQPASKMAEDMRANSCAARNAFTTAAVSTPSIISPASGTWTNNRRPTISGTADANVTVKVYFDNTLKGSVPADDSGAWTFTLTADLADAVYSVNAEAVDAASTTSPRSSAISLGIDTQPPDTDYWTGPNGALTRLKSAKFGLLTTETSSPRFRYSLDGAGYLECGATLTLDNLSEGAHTVLVSAIDAAGNVDPEPLLLEWVVDSIPPKTTLRLKQPDISNVVDVVHYMTSNEDKVTYECSLDGAAFKACASGASFSPPEGVHTLQVRGKDEAGNVEDPPVSHTFTIDRTPPAAPIVSEPMDALLTNKPSVSVVGSAEPNSTITVYFNGSQSVSGTVSVDSVGTWRFTPVSPLADGSYQVTATATDVAGNTSGVSTARSVQVDTLPPKTTFSEKPEAETVSTSATFGFESETKATFQCSLDGAAFGTCSSPVSFDSLPLGSHVFQVKATDAAGNTEPTPASISWSITNAVQPAEGCSCSSPSGDPSAAMMALAGLAALVSRRRRQ